jgi:hypothetical protein
MTRLKPQEFLISLDKLFESTREKGRVYVVMKHSAALNISQTALSVGMLSIGCYMSSNGARLRLAVEME